MHTLESAHFQWQSPENQQLAIYSGSVFYDEDGALIHEQNVDQTRMDAWLDMRMAIHQARAERIDYRVVTKPGVAQTSVPVGYVGHVHPDETESVTALVSDLAQREIPRLEIFKANILGAVEDQRGHVAPHQLATNHRQAVDEYRQFKMSNGRVRESNDADAVWGRRIDLNRHALIIGKPLTMDEAIAQLPIAELRLFFEAIRSQTALKLMVMVHEDSEFGADTPEQLAQGRHGVYFYDTVYDEREDSDHQLVLQLVNSWRQAVLAAGMTLFTGIDDPTDPYLGYEIDNGYEYRSTMTKDGQETVDGTLEAALVKLGGIGLNTIERVFVLEVPGKYSPEQKKQVITLFNDTVVVPYLAAKELC